MNIQKVISKLVSIIKSLLEGKEVVSLHYIIVAYVKVVERKLQIKWR